MADIREHETHKKPFTENEPPKKRQKSSCDIEKRSQVVYHGDLKCSDCTNGAYWYVEERNHYMCGVCSKKFKKNRRPLPKRSAKEQKIAREAMAKTHMAEIEEQSTKNRTAGNLGSVSLYRMKMLHTPPDMSGVLKVFPNFKHQNRMDGFGCMKLSPKFLGPVMHGQPGLPPAKNIENFHQGSKCFREETLPLSDNPSPLFYENRLKFYEDPEPHRHKYLGTGTNKNVPLYFLWVDKENKEHRLTYVESRQFYCTFYERLASAQNDFQELQQKLRNGTDICICGYDAIPLGPHETIEQAYCDASKPFGHELVLYTMLSEQWPWKKYKTFEF